MSADRELLELAAKAYGLTDYYVSEWDGCASLMHSPDPTVGPSVWDSLTDDGDALRLALTVGLNIHQGMVIPQQVHHIAKGEFWLIDEEDKSDIFAATRRAIVRAAAEIGKALP